MKSKKVIYFVLLILVLQVVVLVLLNFNLVSSPLMIDEDEIQLFPSPHGRKSRTMRQELSPRLQVFSATRMNSPFPSTSQHQEVTGEQSQTTQSSVKALSGNATLQSLGIEHSKNQPLTSASQTAITSNLHSTVDEAHNTNRNHKMDHSVFNNSLTTTKYPSIIKKNTGTKSTVFPSTTGKVPSISAQRLNRLKPPSMLVAHEDLSQLEMAAHRERLHFLKSERKRQAEVIQRAKVKKERLTHAKVVKDHKDDTRRRKGEELHKVWNERKKRLDKSISTLQGLNEGDEDTISHLDNYFREVCSRVLEPLVECSNKTMPRKLSPFEASGGDIMFTMRTTVSYHETRLPVLLETWLGDMEPGNVFLVTDGGDEDLEWKLNTLGMRYVNIEAGKSHNRSDLCCKAGVELELLFSPENSKFNWLCHVDDDMYVNLMPLVKALSHFDPVKDKVYFGRSGSPLDKPRVVKNNSLIGTPGRRFHFAVGGFYCLSRALLEESRPYLVGCKAFQDSCRKAQEPEDVTVGLIVGVMLNGNLQRTEMIFSHGLDLLSNTPTPYLKHQIAFSYGFGAEGSWTIIPNVVYVPGGLFNIDEDITQFKSLHCHFYPKLQWCVEKKKQVVEDKKRREEGRIYECSCSWKKLICCQVYKDAYAKYVIARYNEKQKKEKETEKEQKS